MQSFNKVAEKPKLDTQLSGLSRIAQPDQAASASIASKPERLFVDLTT